MRRREFIALAGASVASPFAALAQEPGRMYRIGILFPFRLEPPDAKAALLDELKRAGFIEGKNLTIELRAFAPHPERLSDYAAELVKGGPDVIFATGAPVILAVEEATKTIPILGLGGVEDLLGSELLNSMARPNGNLTGVTFLSNEVDGKRQEILIEAVPGIRKIAVLADAKLNNLRFDALKEGARARNVELLIYRIASGEEIADAVNSAKTSGAEAVNVLASVMFFAFRQIIIERTLALRLPAMYEELNMAEEGGFAAYGPTWLHIGTIYARQAVQLLRGIKVADIPVQVPTKFELLINLKTAKAMGVTVPEALLARADKVIE